MDLLTQKEERWLRDRGVGVMSYGMNDKLPQPEGLPGKKLIVAFWTIKPLNGPQYRSASFLRAVGYQAWDGQRKVGTFVERVESIYQDDEPRWFSEFFRRRALKRAMRAIGL